MTRALALGCLIGAGLLAGYAWVTRKPRSKGQPGQPAPLMLTRLDGTRVPMPDCSLRGFVSPPLPQQLTEEEFQRWFIEPQFRARPE